MVQTSGTPSGIFSSPRKQRQFFILSGVVLIAGIVAILATTVFKGTGNAFPNQFSNKPAQVSHPEKTVPISKDQISLMRQFIVTAVARKNLDKAYSLVGPDLKGGLSRAAWRSGNIPVLAYQADNAATLAFKTDYSYKTQALFEANLHAKPGTESRPSLLFFVGVKRQGGKADGKWLVNYFEPNWRPPVPMAPG